MNEDKAFALFRLLFAPIPSLWHTPRKAKATPKSVVVLYQGCQNFKYVANCAIFRKTCDNVILPPARKESQVGIFFNYLRFFYKSFDGFPSDYLATLAQMLSCINKVGGGRRGFCGKVTAADHLCGLWRAVNRGVGPFLSRDSCSQGGRGDLT